MDFLSKKHVVNNDLIPEYYVENSHVPIIPREIFMQVLEEMALRANMHNGKNGNRRIYSSNKPCTAFCSAGSAGKSTVVCIGTTGDADLSSGAASAASKKKARTALSERSTRKACKMLC